MPTSGNLYALCTVRQRDYCIIGMVFFNDKLKIDITTALSRMVESFKINHTALSMSNPRLCIKTKSGFTLHVLFREFRAPGTPLGIYFICAACDTHRQSLVNSFLTDFANDFDASPSAINTAETRSDPDSLNRTITSTSKQYLRKYDSSDADLLGQVHADMQDIKDVTSQNVSKMRVNQEKLLGIEEKASTLQTSASMFKTEAKAVERSARKRRIIIILIVVVICIIVLLIIIIPLITAFAKK